MIKELKVAGGIVLAGSYLTYILDVYTLNTKLKCLFIFTYFCIMGVILLGLRRRFVPKSNRHTRLIAGVLAALLLVSFQDFFLPVQKETMITLSAVGSEGEQPQKEVWLSGIEIDGERAALADVTVENNEHWTFIPEYDSYAFYPAEDIHENWLTLSAFAEEVKLQFEQNSWSGNVEVQDSSGTVSRLTLTAEEQTVVPHVIHTERTYGLGQRVVLNAGAFMVLYFFLEAFVAAMIRKRAAAA